MKEESDPKTVAMTEGGRIVQNVVLYKNQYQDFLSGRSREIAKWLKKPTCPLIIHTVRLLYCQDTIYPECHISTFLTRISEQLRI